jgi:hypothetical protein
MCKGFDLQLMLLRLAEQAAVTTWLFSASK